MVKWQDVKKYLIGSSVGIVVLFSALFLLTGFEYEHSGDIVCGETCESYINVTTTYWRICFDSYNGTKYEDETLFKKQTRSRTLHINLDKVDNIIHTEPEVEVDWLVPTYGNKWRPIKNGDCWERRKVNKIKLVGHKEASQTIKWGFDLGDKVNIDPQWIGEGKKKETYTSGSDRICYGSTCTLTLWSGIRNVYEDNIWKRVENARSLKDKGFNIVYLEKDLSFNIIVNDFNVSYMDMDLEFLGDPNDYPTFCQVTDELNAKCDFKLDEKWEEVNETTGEIIKKSQLKFQYKWEMKQGEIIKGDKVKYEYKGNPFNKFTFGGASTTIQLQDANTKNLDDTFVANTQPTADFGPCTFLRLASAPDSPTDFEELTLKFNISSIPDNVLINNASLNLYLSAEGVGAGESISGDVHHIYSFPNFNISNSDWTEGDACSGIGGSCTGNEMCWNERPSDSSEYNLTYESSIAFGESPAITWYGWNITEMINKSYSESNTNISIWVKSRILSGSPDLFGRLTFNSKEHATTSLRPYINITYTEMAPTQCSPTLNEDWEISDNQVCDAVDVTTGTGGIVLISGGNLTLINNANVTTSGINKTDSGGYIVVYPGSQLRKI